MEIIGMMQNCGFWEGEGISSLLVFVVMRKGGTMGRIAYQQQ
jgi:hypothetical protein